MIPEDLNPKIALSLMLKGIPNVKKQEAKVTPSQTSSPHKAKEQQRSNASESLKSVETKPFEEMPTDYQELQYKINVLEDFYSSGRRDSVTDIQAFSRYYLPKITEQVENTPNITEDQKKDSYRTLFFTSLQVLGLDRQLQLSKSTVESLGEKDDRDLDGNLRQIWQEKINAADIQRRT